MCAFRLKEPGYIRLSGISRIPEPVGGHCDIYCVFPDVVAGTLTSPSLGDCIIVVGYSGVCTGGTTESGSMDGNPVKGSTKTLLYVDY